MDKDYVKSFLEKWSERERREASCSHVSFKKDTQRNYNGMFGYTCQDCGYIMEM